MSTGLLPPLANLDIIRSSTATTKVDTAIMQLMMSVTFWAIGNTTWLSTLDTMVVMELSGYVNDVATNVTFVILSLMNETVLFIPLIILFEELPPTSNNTVADGRAVVNVVLSEIFISSVVSITATFF